MLHGVFDYFLDQPPITDDSYAQTLARLIHAVPEAAWRENDRRRAADRSSNDAAYLREAYLAVAAPTVMESRDEIHRRARNGELIIFDAIDDVRDLPADAVEALTDRLCGAIEAIIDSAAKGLHSRGGIDPGHALALLGAWHPSSARWDVIEALLTAPHVLSQELSGTLQILAVHGAKLSDEAKERLVQHVSALRDREPTQSFFDDKDIRSIAAEAFAALTVETTRKAVVRELLIGDTAHRAASARIIERFEDKAHAEILLALAGDASDDVRNAALSALSRLAVAGYSSNEVMTFLLQALESGGRQSAAAVISRLNQTSGGLPVSELLAAAMRHPSAQIRNAARRNSDD